MGQFLKLNRRITQPTSSTSITIQNNDSRGHRPNPNPQYMKNPLFLDGLIRQILLLEGPQRDAAEEQRVAREADGGDPLAGGER
jgi:hypothetical protein